MSIIKQFTDKGATIAWSPLRETPNLIASGTKEGGGGGFDDYGGELAIHRIDLHTTDLKPEVIGSLKTPTRFSSLAWGSPAKANSTNKLGLLVGGMSDGIINVWDAAKITEDAGEASVITVIERHSTAVRAVAFNPHDSLNHLLAAGSADGDISIINLENPTVPTVASPLTGETRLEHEITGVAWNSSVSHILATSTDGGSVVVWDLRENKPWCTLKDPHRASVGALCWHPDDGLYLATGANDDSRPVVRIWDLRTSTTVPLTEFMGHTKGILSIDWCPHDPNLLISAGKDQHTYIWDIRNGKVIGEAPASTGGQGIVTAPGATGQRLGGLSSTSAPATASASDGSAANVFGTPAPANASSVFGAPPNPAFGAETAASLFGSTLGTSVGGGIAGSSGRRYELKWSKHLPAVFAACSLDRTVTIHSVSAVSHTQTPKISLPGYSGTPELTFNCAPKWLKRPIGAVFGFGGKLLYFGAPNGAVNVPVRTLPVSYNKELKIAQVNVDHEIEARANQVNDLLSALDSEQVDFKALIDQRIAQSQAAGEPETTTNVWQVMRLLLEPDYRQRVITFLGYSLPKSPELTLDNASVTDAASTAQSVDPSVQQTQQQFEQMSLQQYQQPGMDGQYQQQDHQYGHMQQEQQQQQQQQQQSNPYGTTGLSAFDSPFAPLPGDASLVSAEDIFSSSVAPADADAKVEPGSPVGSVATAATSTTGTGTGTGTITNGEDKTEIAEGVSEQGASTGAGAFATPFTEPRAPSPSSLLGDAAPGAAVAEADDANVKYVKKRVPTEEDDNKIKFPLLVGDFSTAVDACLAQDRMADALLLAAAAGQADLWERTREQYFERKQSPLTNLFRYVLKHDLEGLIHNTPATQWKETLAVLATYASTSTDFSKYAEALGDRLYNEAKDESAATIVYMISLSAYKVNRLWTAQYEHTATIDTQTQLLPVLIEKCLLFRRAATIAAGQDDIEKGQPETTAILAYANLLADEGKLSTAAALATRIRDVVDPNTGQRTASAAIGRELRDRLLRAFGHHDINTPGGMAIANQEFPYEPLDIPEVQAVPRSVAQGVQASAQTGAPASTGVQGSGVVPGVQDTMHGQTAQGLGADHGQYPGYAGGAPATAQTHFGATPQQSQQPQQQQMHQPHVAAHTMPQQPQHHHQQHQGLGQTHQPTHTTAPHTHTQYGHRPAQTSLPPTAPSGYVPGTQTPQSVSSIRSASSHTSAFPQPHATHGTVGTGFGQPHTTAGQHGGVTTATTAGTSTVTPSVGHGFHHPPAGAYQSRTQTPSHGQTTPSSGLSASAPAPATAGYTGFARPQAPAAANQPKMQYGGPGAGPFGFGGAQTTQQVEPTPAQPVESAPPAPTPKELTPEQQKIVDTLLGLSTHLASLPLTPMEKKNLQDANNSIEVLRTKFSLSEIPPDTEAKLITLTEHAANYSLSAATAVQTELAKNWNVCKDWIRAVRNILTLASVKYPGR